MTMPKLPKLPGQSGPYIPSGALLTIDQAIKPTDVHVVLANVNGHPGIGVCGNTFAPPAHPPFKSAIPRHPIDPSSIVGVVCSYTVDL